jgi:hypothetical protein
MVKKLEDTKVATPYQPQLPSALTSICHTSPQKPYDKSSGLYKLGHGEKSVVWYWEFDMDKQHFHEFQTVNFTEVMKIYKKSKFDLWHESWELPS